jgi:hypothetical protein
MKKKDKEQEKWIKDNEEVRNWLSELERRSSNTAKSRRYHLYHYCQWLAKEKKIPTTKQLLNHYKILRKKSEEYLHIDWIKEYLFSMGKAKSFSWREGCLSAIREFYRFNRCPLPDERIDLTIRDVDGNHLREQSVLKTMTLEDFRKLIEPAKIREKAILLINLQSGMGVGEFCNQFNICTCTPEMIRKHGHNCIPVSTLKQLKENRNPIKIYPLIAFKQRNLNDKHTVYFTYIGKDAIETLKQYLVFRKQLVESAMEEYRKLEERASKGQYLRKWEKKRLQLLRERLKVITPDLKDGEPIFLNNTLTPTEEWNIQNSVRILKKQTGLLDRQFTPHTTRDLFKTTCHHTGVDPLISEYWIRHSLDKYGYDQLDKTNPEDFEKEYNKVVGELNIISRTERIAQQEEVGELKDQLRQLQDFKQKMETELLSHLEVINDLNNEDRQLYLQHLIEALKKAKD